MLRQTNAQVSNGTRAPRSILRKSFDTAASRKSNFDRVFTAVRVMRGSGAEVIDGLEDSKGLNW
jgi:hypothetical protein